MGEAWDHLFKPNLPAYASLLESVVTAHISAAHALQTLGRESPSNYDPFQFRRQSIEPHGQDAYVRMIDVLIDAAREILQHLLQARPREATDLIGRWFGSKIPMLRRLALHGFAQLGDITADAKLRWLLDNQLLYSFKTDVFGFLRQCYPLASEAARRELIGHAMQGPTDELFKGAEERSKAYERFNLIVWLKRIAPECTIADEALGQLKRQNPDFAARDHPDFDLWSSGVVSLEPSERFNVNEILTMEPAVFLNELQTAKPPSAFDRLGSDYRGAASAAVARQYEWGIGLLNALVKHGLADADLWASVCQGWRNATLAPEGWQRVLELAESVQAPRAFLRSVCRGAPTWRAARAKRDPR